MIIGVLWRNRHFQSYQCPMISEARAFCSITFCSYCIRRRSRSRRRRGRRRRTTDRFERCCCSNAKLSLRKQPHTHLSCHSEKKAIRKVDISTEEHPRPLHSLGVDAALDRIKTTIATLQRRRTVKEQALAFIIMHSSSFQQHCKTNQNQK